jgi:hypothetical protein
VPRFLARFEDTYGRLGKTERILSVAAAHHRLLWIHPFLDGNSRVAAPKSGGGGGDFDGKINEIAAMAGSFGDQHRLHQSDHFMAVYDR